MPTNIDAFMRELDTLKEKPAKLIGLARNTLAVTLEGEIKDNWPVDTGFSRAAWHIAPEPAQDIANPGGAVSGDALFSSSFPDDPFAPVYVACGANYAQFIEYGTRHQAARLVATNAVQRVEQQADAIFARLVAEEGF